MSFEQKVARYIELKTSRAKLTEATKKVRVPEKELYEDLLVYVETNGKQTNVLNSFDISVSTRRAMPKWSQENLALWIAEYIDSTNAPITKQEASDVATFIMECRQDTKYRTETTSNLVVTDKNKKQAQAEARKRKREADLHAHASALEAKRQLLTQGDQGVIDESVAAPAPSPFELDKAF